MTLSIMSTNESLQACTSMIGMQQEIEKLPLKLSMTIIFWIPTAVAILMLALSF